MYEENGDAGVRGTQAAVWLGIQIDARLWPEAGRLRYRLFEGG